VRKRYAARARASIQNLSKILARTWGHRGATPSGYAFMSDILRVHGVEYRNFVSATHRARARL
jgi:hypothetical protein